MKIGIYGINHITISFGLILIKSGFNVLFFDKNEEILMNLKSKMSTYKDPQIQKTLYEVDNINCENDETNFIDWSDIIFTSPILELNSQNEYDTSELFNVAEGFFNLSKSDKYPANKKFVIFSNSNPGVIDQIQSKLNIFSIQVGYIPLSPSMEDTINSIKHKSTLVIGTHYNELFEELSDIFIKITNQSINIFKLTPLIAEFYKILTNVYLGMKINFANYVGQILLKKGEEENIDILLRTLSSGLEMNNNYFNFGFGFGGNKIPSDISVITKYCDNNNIDIELLNYIDNINKNHSKFLKEYYISKNNDIFIPFIIEDISYKRNSNRLINSQRLKLCTDLLDLGYSVNVKTNTDIGDDLISLSKNHGGRLKFFRESTSPNGYKINIK
jgi:UDP-N-acetyl-D-glucosamine dehydrogenase